MLDFLEPVHLFGGEDGSLGKGLLAFGHGEMIHRLLDHLDVFHRFEHGLGGNGEGHQHTRNGGMDARVEEKEPHHGAKHEIESFALYAHHPAEGKDCKESSGHEQIDKLDVRRIAGGDDNDAADVIGHGKSGEEYFK